MRTTVTKEFNFAASHRLCDPSMSEKENRELFGLCNNEPSHGHNYKMFVSVAGPLVNGMIINFKDLKAIVNENIVDKVDHTFLNDLPMFQGKVTTCETMTQVFWPILETALDKLNIELTKIIIYETDTSYCTIEREN